MGNPSLKGYFGEKSIESLLTVLQDNGIKFIYNAAIPTDSGTITQVDFIIFSKSILACLESKNWSGTVKVPNNFYTEKWQVFYEKRIIAPGYSPLEQNEKHVKYVEELSYHRLHYENIIVFPSNPVIINKQWWTCTVNDLIDLLLNSPEIYTQSVIDDEYKQLKSISDNNSDALFDRELNRIINNETTNLF